MTNRSKKTTTVDANSTGSANYDPYVTKSAYGALDQANSILTRPYTPYQGEAVAPLSQNEQTAGMQANTGYKPAVDQINAAGTAFDQGGTNQYSDAAAGEINTSADNKYSDRAAGMVTPGNFSGASDLIEGGARAFPDAWNAGDIDPYMKYLADPQITASNRDYEQQRNVERARQTMNGAFGGDRAALTESNLASRHEENLAQIRGSAFNTALGTFESDQQRKVGAGTALGGLAAEKAGTANSAATALAGIGDAQAQRHLAAGTALGALGASNAQLKLSSGQGKLATGSALAGVNQQQIQDLMTTGNVGRVLQQSKDNFNYGQFLEARDWNVNNLGPLLQTLSSIPKNISQNQSTHQIATEMQQSGGSAQVIGAAAAIAGAFFTGGASLAVGAGLTAAGAGGKQAGDASSLDKNIASSGSGTSWNGAFGNMYDELGKMNALPAPAQPEMMGKTFMPSFTLPNTTAYTGPLTALQAQ